MKATNKRMSFQVRYRPLWFFSNHPVMNLHTFNVCRNGSILIAGLALKRFIVRTRLIYFFVVEGRQAISANIGWFARQQLLVLFVKKRQYSFLIFYDILSSSLKLLLIMIDCPHNQSVHQLIFVHILWQLRCFRKSKSELSCYRHLWLCWLAKSCRDILWKGCLVELLSDLIRLFHAY